MRDVRDCRVVPDIACEMAIRIQQSQKSKKQHGKLRRQMRVSTDGVLKGGTVVDNVGQ